MKGFIITESEKNSIRNLYKNKGLIKEQTEPEPKNTKTNCITVEVIGSFTKMVTENPDNIKNFITKLNEEIAKNELLKKAYDDGSMYVGSIKLMGGASNTYNKKPVKPTMDNNYVPQTYPDDSKYTGDFEANLQLAEDRAKNLWTELQTSLPNNNITIGKGVEPTFEKYVIDTNGSNDTTNAAAINAKTMNAGQIVKMTVDLCGIPETTKTCFEKATIEVHFEGDKKGNIKHDCNKAVYEIYANGVLLSKRDGKPYASLNNKPSSNINSQFVADEESGRLRYNYFDITADGVNKAFLNDGVWNKYEGKLLITAKCIQPASAWGTDSQDKINMGYTEKQHCHAWVGDIKFSSKSLEQKEIKTVGAGAESLIPGITLATPDAKDVLVNVATFDACSAMFAKK